MGQGCGRALGFRCQVHVAARSTRDRGSSLALVRFLSGTDPLQSSDGVGLTGLSGRSRVQDSGCGDEVVVGGGQVVTFCPPLLVFKFVPSRDC